MIKRWFAAGMLNTERSVRRLKATGRCRRSSLRSPVTSKLFHRHGMLHESHERTNGRPPPSGRDSKLDARTTSAPES